jgi:hypothetical protein
LPSAPALAPALGAGQGEDEGALTGRGSSSSALAPAMGVGHGERKRHGGGEEEAPAAELDLVQPRAVAAAARGWWWRGWLRDEGDHGAHGGIHGADGVGVARHVGECLAVAQQLARQRGGAPSVPALEGLRGRDATDPEVLAPLQFTGNNLSIGTLSHMLVRIRHLGAVRW